MNALNKITIEKASPSSKKKAFEASSQWEKKVRCQYQEIQKRSAEMKIQL